MSTTPEPGTPSTPARQPRKQRLANVAAAHYRAQMRQAAAGWPEDAWKCEETEPHECAVGFYLSPEIENEFIIEVRRILGPD